MNKTIYSISDLHLEFEDRGLELLEKCPEADILVLPGDVGNATTCLKDIKNFLIAAKEKYSDVIFVAGNHEFYGSNYDRIKVIDNLRKISEETKTHFLHRESKIVQNIEFIGTTLWSLIDKIAYSSMNDSRQGVFRSQTEYVIEFVDDYRFLQKSLQTNGSYPRVVITHHLPSSRLIHKRFWDHPANSGFYTNILDDLNMHGVNYWFCGHTHEYADYKYGDSKLIVNPVGYPEEHKSTKLSTQTYKI